MMLRYGLTNGQTRTIDCRVQNGVWFDVKWRMIGWGDLSNDDFVRISKTIPFGELFIVADSKFQPAAYGIEDCCWLVERGCIYLVLRGSQDLSDETEEHMQGVRFRRIIRETAANVIARISRLNSR